MGKQYLVVKVANQRGSVVLNLIPLAGMLTREAAEACLKQASEAEPGSMFMIQEVGAA